MNPIIPKFKLFGDSDHVLPILTKFLNNYKRIKTALLDSLAKIQNAASVKNAVQAKLEAANEALRGAAALGATFFRKDAVLSPVHNCNACRQKGQQGIIYEGEVTCGECGAPNPMVGRQRNPRAED